MEDNLRNAIEQMKNGEEQGFNEVYSQTYNRVYFRAKQIMKKDEDAQDLTQIVFVEAYKSIGTLQASEALYNWLDGITYRQGMKIYRKQRDVLLTEEAEGLFETLENNDISTVPELTVDQKATSEIIRGIMEELPELQKAAVVMFYFDGMKVEQIADTMECSANTIKSRLNYARKYIKDRVEEREKKEGYRLHVFGLPVLWFAIKTLSDRTTLTAQAAQGIYNGACTDVGLQATAITAVTTGAATAGGAQTAATAGSAQAAATAGSAQAVGAAAGEAAQAAGIGAKFAALGTGMKTLMMVGAVAVLGTGVAGTAYLVNANKAEETRVVNRRAIEGTLEENLSGCLRVFVDDEHSRYLDATKISDDEYRFFATDLQEYFKQDETVRLISYLPENIGIYYAEIKTPPDMGVVNAPRIMNEYYDVQFDIQTDYDIVVKVDYMENIVYEEEPEYPEIAEEGTEYPGTAEEGNTGDLQTFELTEEAGRQISAFAASAYQCNYSSVNSGSGWNIFSMTPDDCLFFLKDYRDMATATFGAANPNPSDLPYRWSNGRITEQEAADFFRDGLGIEIPSDYSYSFSNEGGSLKLGNGRLRSTFDSRTLQVAGGPVEVVSQDENGVVLSGTCYWYDPEETVYQFTVTGVPSGNKEVFGGLTITDIQISEGAADSTDTVDADYHLMAEQCASIIQDQKATSGFDFDGYYLNDIDKDKIPELIIREGTCRADYRYAVYQFDGTQMVRVKDAPDGELYGSPDEQGIYIRWMGMGDEVDTLYKVDSVETLFNGAMPYENEEYDIAYEFPMGTYSLTIYDESDTEGVYQNIISLVS